MIKISTIPNLKQYLITTCDMSPILATRITYALNSYCVNAKDIQTVYTQLSTVVNDVLNILNNYPNKSKNLTKEYGYDNVDELIEVLDTFITTTEAEELLVEEEFVDEDEERKVWSVGEYSLWVNDLKNATHITLFKDKKRVGVLSTSGTYENEDGKWLKISLADIQKSYRGMGLGKKLYQILLQYSSPEYVGIVSYLPDRYNVTEVPKIYEKLGGFVKGDFAYIPKQKDDIKESIVKEDNNFIKTLKKLQEGNETRKDILTESSIHDILQKGDSVYWEHDPDGIPNEVLDKIDSDTVIDTTAIIIKANGDIWISNDEHPMSDSAKWNIYHKADKFSDQRIQKSNYDGEDYVAQRLRSRR